MKDFDIDFSDYETESPYETSVSLLNTEKKESADSKVFNKFKDSEIDFSDYESPNEILRKEIDSEASKKVDDKSIEGPKENESVFMKSLKDMFTNLPGQIALGLTQAVTSPLDLMKLWMTGEALVGLDEAEEASLKEGIPFDREKEQSKILNTIETSVPTLSMAEKWLNDQNVSTQPQDTVQKIFRTISEFAGLPKVGKSPKLGLKPLSPEQNALRETSEKFGLRKFAGMESEKPPGITPIVSAEKEASLSKELGETSKKAVDDLIDQKISVKKFRDEYGINLEEAYDVAYDAARKTASKMGKEPINYSNVFEWMDQQIAKTKSSSPSLSASQKAYINILKKEKKDLTKKVTKKSGPTLYGPNGEEITQKAVSKRVAKDMTADQSLNQIKNYNDNVKGIWKKPEFAGTENAVKDAYAGLNEQFIKAIEKANPTLSKEIKFANKIFHEGSKLNQVENILDKAFSDGYNPNKLARILSSKRDRSFISRSLGKDGVQDLERIAKYGQEAQKKIFKHIKNPKTVKDYLNSMTPMQLGLLLGGKAHIGAVYYIPKAALHRLQGHLLTRNGTKKAYKQFMKDSAKYGSFPLSKSLIESSKLLNDAIEDEFGSEEELLRISSQ